MKDIGFEETVVDEAYRNIIFSIDDEGLVDLEKVATRLTELRGKYLKGEIK